MRPMCTLALFVCLVAGSAACGGSPPAAFVPPPAGTETGTEDPAPTVDPYGDSGCDACHGSDGGDGLATDIRCIAFARLDGYLRDPDTPHAGGAYVDLADAELDTLETFLAAGGCDGGGTAGLNCVGCHAATQDNGDGTPATGRREVVSEFSLTSHHLDPASLDNRDCAVCHEMSRHMQGEVRLLNVDAPNDPAEVIILTGDPESDAAEAAKLEPFCLACHDADGAGGNAPFQDGQVPAVIDAQVWANTSHATQTSGCFDCHASHGTANGSLLRSTYSVVEQKNYAASDYQACWDCHDESDIVDVENTFEKLHEKHVKSEGLACVNCHDTHGAYDADERGLISFAYAVNNDFNLSLLTGGTLSSAYAVNTSQSTASCALRCHGEEHEPLTYSFAGR